MLVDFHVELGSDEVEHGVVTEGAPLGVDDHARRVEVRHGHGLDVLAQFHVTRVGASADDDADAALPVLVGARHKSAGGVVDDRRHVDIDVLQRKAQQLDNGRLEVHAATATQA